MKINRVMIVDDDREFLEELSEALQLGNYDIVSIGDALLAVAAAVKLKPAVILLDIKMPNKTGFHIANDLRLNWQTAGIPVLAMSAFFTEDRYGKAVMKACGIKGFIRKPFDPSHLISEIKNALAQKEIDEGRPGGRNYFMKFLRRLL